MARLARVSVLVMALLGVALQPSAAATARLRPNPVAEGLAFPTNIAIAADGRIFFAEKDTGDVRIIRDGALLRQPFIHLDVVAGTETGLLGLALHPGFPANPWVYLYFTDQADGRNRLIRVLADGDRGTDVQNMIDGLSAVNGYHNGGDLAFALDGSLFVSIGEGHEASRAQDPNDIGGKILRIEANGTLAPDNPFGPDNPVYSIGHRNSFGLCVDPATGDLWETENGPAGDDEVNRIEAGANYGWPDQLGPGGEPRFVDPVVTYVLTIVPTGCAVLDGALYVGSYGTGLLHRISLPVRPGAARDDVVARFPAGITDVEAGPDGHLYVATSDTIYRIPQASGTARPLDLPSPTMSATGGKAGEHVTARLLAIAAAIAAALGLGFRYAAGRRLRAGQRGRRDPD